MEKVKELKKIRKLSKPKSFDKPEGKKHLDKDFLEELKHKLWSTKGIRFYASSRLKSISKISNINSILSFNFFGILNFIYIYVINFIFWTFPFNNWEYEF